MFVCSKLVAAVLESTWGVLPMEECHVLVECSLYVWNAGLIGGCVVDQEEVVNPLPYVMHEPLQHDLALVAQYGKDHEVMVLRSFRQCESRGSRGDTGGTRHEAGSQ